MPRDVRFVAWATIAFCGLTALQLSEHASLLVHDEPLSPGFATSVRVGFAQTAVALMAGCGLLAMRAWARLWLVLVSSMSLGIFLAWPPDAETLRSVWAGAMQRGGVYMFLAWSWVPELALAICTLAILARPRREFQRLAWSTGALVTIGGLLLTGYHVRGQLRGTQLALESSSAEPHELSALASEEPRVLSAPTVPPGMQVAMESSPGEQHERSAPARGHGTVRLRPTVHGQPIDGVSADDVSIAMQPYEIRWPDGEAGAQGVNVTRVFGTALAIEWAVRNGRIELKSIPAGHYVITAAIRRREGGDLHGRSRHTFRTGDSPADGELPLIATMRLRQPAMVGAQPPRLRSPVKLAWDPVPGTYLYEALLFSRKPGNRSFSQALEAPEWVLDLPSGPWTLELDAVGEDGVTIGAVDGQPTFVVEPD